MPIINVKPHIPAPQVTKPSRIEAPSAKSNVVDTRITPSFTLQTFVQGSSYTVNYYQQILGKDNELLGQDPNKLAVYQQFRKINQLIIKLDGSLTSSQNQENNNFTVTGSGTVHSYIIPNVGDMFAGDVGDGREGIFEVNSSEKKSIYQESVYSISFTLIYFTDQKPDYKADLEKKVIEELYYLQDFIRFGQDPLLSSKDYYNLRSLSTAYNNLINFYVSWFVSDEFKTLLLPKQTSPTYDPYVLQFFLSIVSVSDHPIIQKIKVLNIQNNNDTKLLTIYKALRDRIQVGINLMIPKMGLLDASSFRDNPFYRSIFYSNIEKLVYPLSPNRHTDDSYSGYSHTASDISIQDVGSLVQPFEPELQVNLDAHVGTVPIVHPVLKDTYYVLSEAFYKNKTDKSLLEIVCKNYLEGKNNQISDIVALVQSSHRWGQLEQFYYIPIVLLLIKDLIRDL